MMRMAIEDKNIGNFWAAMLKLQNVSACSPKCQFTKTVSFKLIGKVTVQSIKSDNARVAMKALCEVLILFLKDKSTLSWNVYHKGAFYVEMVDFELKQ